MTALPASSKLFWLTLRTRSPDKSACYYNDAILLLLLLLLMMMMITKINMIITMLKTMIVVVVAMVVVVIATIVAIYNCCKKKNAPNKKTDAAVDRTKTITCSQLSLLQTIRVFAIKHFLSNR